MKNKLETGQITVFLSLILFIVLTVSFMLIEAARIRCLEYIAENTLDVGTFSMLGDYNKILLDKYDLFLLDGAYGNSDLDTQMMSEKLKGYMDYNTSQYKFLNTLNDFNMLNIETDSIEFLEFKLATDECGKLFRDQAIEYMKSKFGIDIIKNITGMINENSSIDSKIELVGKLKEETKDIEKTVENYNKNDNKTESAQSDAGESVPGNNNLNKNNNPIELIKRIKFIDILNIVLEQPEKVSDSKLTQSDILSKRLNLDSISEPEQNFASKVLFDEYILDKYNYLCSGQDNKYQPDGLKYEVEYIISGQNSDKENLRKVVNKLILLREASNVTFLMSDIKSQNECYIAASAIAGFTGNPVIIKGVQTAIMLAWAYAESVMDLRFLLNGDKIPIVKTINSWNCELGMIGEILKGNVIKNKNTQGQEYKDYLNILLFLENTNDKTLYAMDLIELNVRSCDGYENFKFDNCVEGLDVKAVFESSQILWKNSFDYVFTVNKKNSYSLIGG